MAVTLPVLTAQMGSRTYYISKMSGASLSGRVAVASELDDWKDQSLDERFQRMLNSKRVEQDIAPYLANAEDRFFAAIIVWIISDGGIDFESLADHEISIPAAYRSAAQSFGFLVINDARLVALDGQHRLASLRHVVQGHVNGPFRDAVSSDEVTVIFIDDPDVRTARNLFTVLNRSARRVGKNDVLVMGEVDGAAIIARRLVSSELLAPRGLDDHPLVKWESNTITKRDEFLTTLNAIYETVRIVSVASGESILTESDDGTPPPPAVLDRIESISRDWLEALFRSIPRLQELRDTPHLFPDERESGAQYSLLLKPVGFQAFFGGVAAACSATKGGLGDPIDAIRRCSGADWSLESAFWRGILVKSNGTVSTARADITLASDLLAFQISDDPTPQFVSDLRDRFRRQLNDNSANLPQKK